MSMVTDIADIQERVRDSEMDQILDWCAEAEDEGSHYGGMTYEQGIRDTLEWLAGYGDMPQ
jgi:hypothetical protein